ncbi:hypothetical protein [Mucilaginibacter boryungensis]|uniref:Lipocalin-like protein n=1 Tax=Mucilaginibacter boryungensis TaxID=768480 RepID=A0ABR9XFZ8_9SPHI|nr:hypothetical protein [Mucilaginibacter boryungensis]MBE9666318.1 hypothetical protein [Mucilaginibacter boryungensis]
MKCRFILIIGIVILFARCQYDPFADELTTVRPKIKDIIGTYIFEKQTLINNLSNKQTDYSKITLKSDSTFLATHIPNFTGQAEFYYNGVVSAKGKWQIATNGGVANASGGTDTVWGIDLDSLPVNLKHIEFLGKHPPYKLIVTYGDPDEGAVMIFRKQ